MPVALFTLSAFLVCALTLRKKPVPGKIFGVLALLGGFILALPVLVASPFTFLGGCIFFLGAFFLLADVQELAPKKKKTLTGIWYSKKNSQLLLLHPARLLLITFGSLIVLGTVLLLLPAASRQGGISLLDAAFTAVSAVCITGLTVLDTAGTFTGFGQLCILLLIQCGGLGIMTIVTLALHVMGQRLSLRHEQVLTSITDTDHKELFQSLKTILWFTFVLEGLGAAILFLGFLQTGDEAAVAAWRAVFTSVSAFCNAGFALQHDSLVTYQTCPYILYTVSLLILFGGLAPAVSLLLPRWVTGKPVPVPARIALVTTATLLVSGTCCLLAFEWNGVLAGLTFWEKIHNAWFQSVTLRTAGFHSVSFSGLSSPTFLVMLTFMFIGGSPGGTAGGVKTTTIGILAMTFWSNITNRSDVIIRNKRIAFTTVYRAVTIVFSGLIVVFLVVLMLELTQQIPAQAILFETVSALGTVGLSLGATSLLDEVGKVLIMLTMFAGRLGPVTLFMLVSEDRAPAASRRLEEKISLT